ncbi:PKD domain-containing protein [Chryseosolibacter indicus]|uniref:Prolyl oligopeptidase family serine peptidase n=1 Tax=Chryseosolibacter indicus TaxID=2782351 RepID=A0ABS5VW89_9BACT|nr:PKD domain-containing protein [Chryseosolibacter indicus]MBT1705703.1 prolyl oligopeptidase family serine peptidase [Chryseosolibacter indicus]
MKLKVFFSVLLVALVFAINTFAQQTAKVTPTNIGYLEYLPQDYNSNNNKYPIVIALHGIGEKGTTSTNVNDIKTSVAKVANAGLPRYVKYGQQYPFILISPQLKSNMGSWNADYVLKVLNHVKTYLRVDPNRIYLTGLSLGGGGVWSVISKTTDVFAAILPLCSGYNMTSAAQTIADHGIPTWGFHGDADAVVSEAVTINMINAINKYKPAPLAKVTILGGMGHNIWDKVYKETNALTWLLSFKKGVSAPVTAPSNVSPVANAGSDKTITLPTNSITLTGSATDSDGSIASYTWTKKSGGAATLSGGTTNTLKATNLVAGTYVFTLSVKDNKGAVATDDVTIVVKAATTSTTNAAPLASAGKDITIYLPTTTATIGGSAKDSDGTIASYTWTKVSGGTVTLAGATTSTLKLSGLKEGKYVFRLTVKDNKGATDTDDLLVVVKKAAVASL